MIPGDMVEISLIIKQNFVLGFSFQGLLKWFEVTTNAILTRIPLQLCMGFFAESVAFLVDKVF
jgi:hypothetical protein